MSKNSLTKFAKILYNQALEEKERVAQELESEREKTLSQKTEELEKRFKFELKGRRAELEGETRLALSRREAELAKMLRQNRSRAENEIFDAAKEALLEFAKGEKYEGYLKREFEKVATDFCAGTTICTAMERDLELIENICPIKNTKFEKSQDDIIGGFTLANEMLGIFADCTFREKLEEQREEFFKTSGLMIG